MGAVLNALPEPLRALLESRPRLRPLNITYQRLDGRAVYVVENPVSSAFYRVGEREFRFMSCLDGTRSIVDILTYLDRVEPESAIDLGSAMRFLEMLRGDGLLDEPDPGGRAPKPSWLDRLGGLMFLRISFGNPDRFFAWLSRWLGWAVHPVAWLGGLALIVVGGLALTRNADRMRDASLGILAPQHWLWFAVIFVVLRVIHESWHGLVSRRLGARVRDVGVVLILFFPIGYTDVTSSWGLPSRWHRFLVSCAGVFVELCIAAAAALVWTGTGPGLANTLAWQVVLTAGVSSLLANANPLMRFDGYYMMTDVLDLPNLATRSQILTRACFRRFLLGMKGQQIPSLRDRGWRAAALYAPASLVWRILLMVNILAAAGALMRGAGVLLVCVSVAAWSHRPLLQAWRWVASMSWGARAGAAVRMLIPVGATAAVMLIPWRAAAVEPALIDWADRSDVYAGCAGVLQTLPVRPGSHVEAGNELARLDNPELEPEVELLRMRVEREELRTRVALREGDMPEWSATQASRDALADELAHAEERASRRTVTAPAAGVVYDHRLDRRVGQYIKEGERLLTLGHPTDREAVVLISQERHARYGLRHGDPVEVWIPEHDATWTGIVASMSPAARRQVEQPALTALGGGHLEVRSQDREGYELQDPQFEVRVRLSGEGVAGLHAGERGYVRGGEGSPVPLWRLAYAGLERFWSGLLGERG